MRNKIINISRGEYREDVQLAAGEIIVVIEEKYVGPTNCHQRYGERSFWVVPIKACLPYGPVTNGGGHRWEGWLGTTDDEYRESLGTFRIVSARASRQIDQAETLPGYYTVRKTRLELSKIEPEAAIKEVC